MFRRLISREVLQSEFQPIHTRMGYVFLLDQDLGNRECCRHDPEEDSNHLQLDQGKCIEDMQ